MENKREEKQRKEREAEFQTDLQHQAKQLNDCEKQKRKIVYSAPLRDSKARKQGQKEKFTKPDEPPTSTAFKGII